MDELVGEQVKMVVNFSGNGGMRGAADGAGNYNNGRDSNYTSMRGGGNR